MYKNIKPLLTLITLLYTQAISANDINHINGTWHLRVMDGMEVRKARAILDFDMEKMKLSGFDACNRINGSLLKQDKNTLSAPALMTTRMACRGKVQAWVSTRLHATLKENFTLKEESKYGVKGITIKSPSHELFLKRMQREE